MPSHHGSVIFLRHFIIEVAPISHSSPNSTSSDATTFTQPRVGDIIIDIRHPAEAESKPLETGANRCIELPFYSLEQQLDQLDPDICYLLYCEKGIMSRLQAALMREKGFSKVGMFSIKS